MQRIGLDRGRKGKAEAKYIFGNSQIKLAARRGKIYLGACYCVHGGRDSRRLAHFGRFLLALMIAGIERIHLSLRLIYAGK